MLCFSSSTHLNSRRTSSITTPMAKEDPFRPPTQGSDTSDRDVEVLISIPTQEWKPSLHELAILVSLSIVSLMISIDATIIITTLSNITTDLSLTATQAFWVGTSYLLTCAATMPFLAALSDIFGR